MTTREAIDYAENLVVEFADAAMSARTPKDLAYALANMRSWELTARVARNSLRLVVS